MIPGIMAMQQRSLAGGVLWTPLNMAVVPQIYLDAQDSVVTDVSGACSDISNLGSMGADGSFTQVTSSRRPAILASELNGNRVLRFDGVDDVLAANSLAARSVFKNVSDAWVFAVRKKRDIDGSSTTRYLFFSATASGAFRFGATVSGNGTVSPNTPTTFARRLDADPSSTLIGSVVSQGQYAMALHRVAFSTRAGDIYLDATSVASNATLTTAGSTQDAAASVALAIGAVATGLFPADIDLAAIVVSNTALSIGDQQKLEGWAAHKYGLTANLPAGHPYKTVAPTV